MRLSWMDPPFAPSAHDFEMTVVTSLVNNIDELVTDLGQHVDGALIADDRPPVQVDPIEDWEAESEERDLGIAGDLLAMGVADDSIHHVGHDERAQVP